MSFAIRPIRPAEHEAVRALLLANGWSGARFEPSNFTMLIERATESLVALDGDRVVGFARALGDGCFNGYISMLVVDAAYRRQGLGRALVRRLMGDNVDMTWVLRAARPDVQGFYEKLGFRKSEVAMERPRR
jgi:ribosomal protein S18 acetylase RimI-like enzyme